MNNNQLFILLILSPVVLYFLLVIYKKLRQIKRWRKIKKTVFPENYSKILDKCFRPYRSLEPEEKRRLELKVLYFLKFKTFVPIGNFEITSEMKLLIAAQACLLIVNLQGEVYPSLFNIYISATSFVNKENFIDSYTMELAHAPRLGESWKDGPVILSWNSVREGTANWRDGHNVVLHEFVHQLDGSEGTMNGVPELGEADKFRKWKILMSREFFDLRDRLTRHLKTDIDSYAGIDPSEFFAVTVEEFFENSVQLKNKHPKLFQLYLDYFKINPHKWR